MIKALFLDYTGTVIQQRGDDYTELISRIQRNSDLDSPEKVLDWWRGNVTALKQECTPENFLTRYEIAEKVFEKGEKDIRLRDERTQLVTLLQNYMMYAPVFDDVRELFDHSTLPVYIVTDNSEDCVRVCTRRHNLHPYGIVSSESVKAYMPRPDVYEYAAKTAGYNPSEILFVSVDPVALKGAENAGLMTALIDRKSEHRDVDIRRYRSLVEILAHLDK